MRAPDYRETGPRGECSSPGRSHRSPTRRGTALAALALLAGVLAAPAHAQDSVIVSTAHLRLAVAPVTGGASLQILGEGATAAHRLEAPALLLDGVRQQGFALERREAPALLRNEAVELAIEVVNERAVALTWTPRDGQRHDLELHLRSDDETRYYGTGERFNSLNQRGFALPVVTDDRYGNKGVGTHKPVSFFMSNRGYGVWVDSWAPGHFDLSATERFVSKLRFPDDHLRVVLLAGPSLPQILEAFTGLTGRTPVPPPWAFALWKSRDIHHNQDSVYVDIEKLRHYGIPASVLVLDSPWETGFNDFEINRRQFPDPEAMFARVEELGFHTALWLTPFVNTRNVLEVPGIDERTKTFDAAANAGHLVRDAGGEVAIVEWWKGEGGLVDFTSPAANRWWEEQLLKTKAYGARAFKADDGEGNFVPDAVFHDGTPAWRMKNRYSILYDSVMQDFVDRHLDGDGVLIVRSGYTGVQRFPFSWAGDNRGDFSFADGLPSVILAGQNAALSGISLWGTDIAGYAGRPTTEVFVRWTQHSTFTPFMQVHMTSNWGPWDFGEEALEIFRRFAVLRTRLFPYLYDAVHETARTGMPVLRPMVMAFPDDPLSEEHVFQYLYGPDLLVAPMYQVGTRRPVYLPAGSWIDFWSGEVLEGARVLEADAPLDRIPLYVRPGAILPLLPDDVQTLIPRHPRTAPEIVALDDRRVLQVWPGAAGEVATWDGVRASVATREGRATLRLASDRPRPVEVHLMHRRPADLRVPGATVRHDSEAQATVVTFLRLHGEQTLTWSEP